LRVLLKSVFIIAIVAVAMIGVMIPSVFGNDTIDNAGYGGIGSGVTETARHDIEIDSGYAQYDQGKYELAIDTFQFIISRTGNTQFIAESNTGIAMSYHQMGDFKNAVIHYNKGLEWTGYSDEQIDWINGSLSNAQRELDIINQPIQCGKGTIEKNGQCIVDTSNQKSSKGGGCLIATATYGSEMSNEVQQLRELRDNQLLNTKSGTAFMSTFNDIYYSFSPVIADYERENPLFKEAVKIAITPMISSLSLMENANSESEVLGMGLSVIMLNLGMYLGVPAVLIVGIKRRF
jgi:tetratricopeptide (TPR) repeat protein